MGCDCSRSIQKLRIKWTVFFHSLAFVAMLLRIMLFDVLPRHMPASVLAVRQVSRIQTEQWEVLWLFSISSSVSAILTASYNKRKSSYTTIAGNLTSALLHLKILLPAVNNLQHLHGCSPSIITIAAYLLIGSLLLGMVPLAYGVWVNRDKLQSSLLSADWPFISYIFPYKPHVRQQQRQQEIAMADVENTDFYANFSLLRLYWMALAFQVHIFQILFTVQLRYTWWTISG